MDSSKKLVLNSMDQIKSKVNKLDEKQFIANSKLIASGGILYNIESSEDGYLENMKQGYLAMKELNLELSEYGFESYMNELTEYEASL